VVETGGLENRLRRKVLGGSNPSSSASYLMESAPLSGAFFVCAQNVPASLNARLVRNGVIGSDIDTLDQLVDAVLPRD
jgi:hypothetical protein